MEEIDQSFSYVKSLNESLFIAIDEMNKDKKFSFDTLDNTLNQWIQRQTNSSSKDIDLNQIAYNSVHSLYRQILKLFEGAFKCIFILHANAVLTTECPSNQIILNHVNEYLNSYAWKIDDSTSSSQLQFSIDKSQQLLKSFIKAEAMGYSQILLFELTQIGGVISKALTEDYFNICEETDSIEGRQSCLGIARKVTVLLDERLKKSMEQSYRLIKMEQMYNSMVICCWKLSKMINKSVLELLHHLGQFSASTEKIQYPNRFVLIYLLKELSKNCFHIVERQLQSSFLVSLDPTFTEQLATFIISNSQIIQFEEYQEVADNAFHNLGIVDGAKKEELKMIQQEKYDAEKNNLARKLKNIKAIPDERVRYRYVLRTIDGHPGCIIRIKERQFLIHLNQQGEAVVVKIQFISDRWYDYSPGVVETEITYNGLIQQEIEEIFQFISQQQCEPPSILVNIPSQSIYATSTLGYCLANINKHQTESSFLLNFGYSAQNTGNLNLIAQQLPLIGAFVALGQLSYSTFKLSQNNAVNSKNKLSKMGKIAFGTGSQFGGSISGAIIGQAAFPLPIVGGIIGGIIGGIVGQLSSDYAIKKMDETKFKKMICNIEGSIEEEGYWRNTQEMLNILGIKNEFFLDSIPEQVHSNYENVSEDVWMTLYCYLLLAIFFSAKEEQLKKELEKKWEQCQKEEQKNEIEQEINNLNLWNKAVLNSHEWLIKNEVPLSLYLHQIESFINEFVQMV